VSNKTIKASMGIVWLKDAWALFKLQPFTFITMYLFILTVSLLPFLSPVLNVAASLVLPFLVIGFYQVVLKKQSGKSAQLSDVMAPLFEKGNRRPVLHLAMCQVVVALIISLIAQMLFSDMFAVIADAGESVDTAKLFADMAEQFNLGSFLLFVGVLVVNYAAFAFALPLVFFKKYPLMSAIQASLAVFFSNIGALSVFGGVIAFLIVLSVPLQLLPMLVIMPMTYIGFFLAFKSIFSFEVETPNTQPSDKQDTQSGHFDA
jgi:uncharacterized membrane protein